MTATIAIPADSIQADEERLAEIRAARMADAITELHDYVRLKASGETVEDETLIALDKAIELLQFDRNKLKPLIEIQKHIDANQSVLDDGDEELARLYKVMQSTGPAVKAAEEKLHAARNAHKDAVTAESLHAQTLSQLRKTVRENPILFGTPQQALAALFPPNQDPAAMRRALTPNNPFNITHSDI